MGIDLAIIGGTGVYALAELEGFDAFELGLGVDAGAADDGEVDAGGAHGNA